MMAEASAASLLSSPDVLLNILHFVRNGADFLRCELVCVAWRDAVGEDALWEPRPIGYGDTVYKIPRVAGSCRRGCLEKAAFRAMHKIQRTTEGAHQSVLGPVKMRRIVESLYVRCCKNGDPRPRFTDGAIAALYDIVEQWMGGIMEGCLHCTMHRAHNGNDDDLSPPLLSETGGTVGARDFFFELRMVRFVPGAHNSGRFALGSIESWLVEKGLNGSESDFEGDGGEKLLEESCRKLLLSELVNDCSNSELTRIVRRIARRSGVVGITGAAIHSASCYCVGAIGALLNIVYILHPEFSHSELPPSDDDDYSSVDETSDDEDPTPRFLHERWAHPHGVQPGDYPPKSAASFTVTSATVAYAAKALKIADSYYAPRLDDEDSDSSSDDDYGPSGFSVGFGKMD